MSKILVVIDMQNDFITGALGNAECVAAVDPVAEVIKSNAYDEIYYTQDTHGENYMETNEGKHLPVMHCIKGTKGWEIDDKIMDAMQKSNRLVRGFEKNVFGSMELATYAWEQMENTPETQIDLCGVCTGICVISNALLLKATLPEAQIRVLQNACACVTPQSHETALEAMKLCQIEIV